MEPEDLEGLSDRFRAASSLSQRWDRSVVHLLRYRLPLFLPSPVRSHLGVPRPFTPRPKIYCNSTSSTPTIVSCYPNNDSTVSSILSFQFPGGFTVDLARRSPIVELLSVPNALSFFQGNCVSFVIFFLLPN